MEHRRPAKPETKVLSEPAAAQLLARASELDAARAASAAVAELRAAATEAGISPDAFDTALAELPDVSGHHRRRSRRQALVAAVAALIAAGALAVSQTRAPVGPAAPMIEESFVLRCLAPAEAAELIRPLLLDRATVVYSPAHAPRLLTVRATPAQMQRVRSVLDQNEAAGSPACAPSLR